MKSSGTTIICTIGLGAMMFSATSALPQAGLDVPADPLLLLDAMSSGASSSDTAVKSSAVSSSSSSTDSNSQTVLSSTDSSTDSVKASGNAEADSAAFAKAREAWLATSHVTGDVDARFQFTEVPGKGIKIKVFDMYRFNNTKEGYTYAIHTNFVNDTGRTTAERCDPTFGLLNPMDVSENILCDPKLGQYCALGDLSGKHGKINGTENGKPQNFELIDEYLRFYPQNISFIGRSVEVKGKDNELVGCGNIISSLDGTANRKGEPILPAKSTWQDNYAAAAQPAPETNATSAVPIAAPDGQLNTAGLQGANLSIPSAIPAFSQLPDIALIKGPNRPYVASTSYAAAGTGLPKQTVYTEGGKSGGALSSAKVSAVAVTAVAFIGSFALLS